MNDATSRSVWVMFGSYMNNMMHEELAMGQYICSSVSARGVCAVDRYMRCLGS